MSNLQSIRTTNVEQLDQKLLAKQRRNWLLNCRGSTVSSDWRVACVAYRSRVMELIIEISIPKSGIINENSGFVFDLGKAARISYDKENLSCLLRFWISKDENVVFDRGKSAGCYTRVHEMRTR
ncbi:hypothetical protein MKX03_000242 [Papaver bracteatum]|nr:hypothetical protein MKX03_000242 [Papaver bracteatum]